MNEQDDITRLRTQLAAAQTLDNQRIKYIDELVTQRNAVRAQLAAIRHHLDEVKPQLDELKQAAITTHNELVEMASDLAHHLAVPDFARLATLRMSEMTPDQRDDATEGWLRTNVRAFDQVGDLHYCRGDKAQNHIEFLLQRIDHLRGFK